jgi:splicing factor 3B subunit 1
MNEYRVPEMNV